MFYILTFLCFFLNSTDKFFFDPQLNYEIANYSCTIRQHLERANSAAFAGKYNDALQFFKWIEHPNNFYELIQYQGIVNTAATKGNLHLTMYELVSKFDSYLINEGKFIVYQFSTSCAVAPIQRWVILNGPIDSGKVLPLMAGINYHRKRLNI